VHAMNCFVPVEYGPRVLLLGLDVKKTNACATEIHGHKDNCAVS
jgi:hypothetical protein